MLARVGIALYWIASCIAAFLALGTVVVIALGMFNAMGFKSENNILEAFVFIPAVLIWLIGRACRYLLAGT
ncbi:MAG TPA: hypothetical protein VKT73_01465 [Xanthobacteraceae bacterium]|nr:hypothetical protein [Xanthobacteraceae bacterium]